MALWKPSPLADGSYADDCRPWSDQDVCNYIPVFAESQGTRSKVLLRDLPGLVEFSTIGDGPHRCGVNVQGKCFVVSGRILYQVYPSGQCRIIGVIPGTGRVVPIFNQIAGGNQILFLNGSAGYVYNTVTGVFGQVTDPGFPGGITGDYINSLGIFVEPGRRFWGNSALADLTDYNALEEYQGETSPDLGVALRELHNQVYFFQEKTIDVYNNTGVTNRLFENTKSTINRGCASSHCVEKLDNTLFFVGDDGNVYRLGGYIPERISTVAIEQDLARCNLSKAFASIWNDRVYYLTCPDGHTWGYDISTRRWHRRTSTHNGVPMDRWRLNTLFKWNGAYYGGEFNSGRLFKLVDKHYLEGPDEHTRSITQPVLHNNGNRLFVHGVKFEVDTGGPASEYVAGVVPVPQVPGTLYVTNAYATGPSYYIIDSATNAITTTGPNIAALWMPWLNAAGTKLYIDDITNAKTGFITLASNALTDLTGTNYDAGNTTGQMVVDSTGTYAYAANFANTRLHKIALADGTIVNTQVLPTGPMACCITSDDATVYVTVADGFYAYDTVAMTKTLHDLSASYSGIRAVALNPAEDKLYIVCIRNSGAAPVLLVTTTAGVFVSEIVLPGLDSGHPGDDVAFHPDGSVFAVCDYNLGTGKVWIYRTSDHALLHTITTGQHLRGKLAWHPTGWRLYSVNMAAGTVSVIDALNDYAVIATIPVPTNPSGIYIDA
jgi:YVTN family beta-propeller protein